MRIPRLLAISVLLPGLLAVPVVNVSYAAPRPVEPELQTIQVLIPEVGPGGVPPVDAAPQGAVPQDLPSTPEEDASDAPGEVVETAPIDAEGFSLVGATWAEDSVDAAPAVEVRTESTSGWSDWQPLPPLEGGPDPDTEEGRRAVTTATAPLWVGKSTAVQVRVAAGADAVTSAAGEAPAAALPDAIDLVLVDPGASPADAPSAGGPMASADAADGTPVIITRAEWGADESLRNCGYSYNGTIKAGILHHTAGPNTYSTQQQAIQQLRADYAYHTRTLGWCDLGYNFVVDKWGNIYEGRFGGADQPVVGAHAGGFNKDTFGVSMLGTFSSQAPPAAMLRSVEKVMAWKLAMYGVDPQGSTQLTSAGGGTARYPAGETVTVRTLSGHRDVGFTECPGASGYEQLGGIRQRAAAMVNDFSVRWYTRKNLATGIADNIFPFGSVGAIVLACDWTGTGPETAGAFRSGEWALRRSNSAGPPDIKVSYGSPGDVPVCGDWDGDGRVGIGVYRPSNYTFYLRNSVTSGVADLTVAYGNRGDRPVVGDWDGDGRSTVGVFRPSDVTFYLRNENSTGRAHGAIPFGNSTDTPVVGTWNGGRFTTIGVYRAGVLYLKNSNFPGPRDLAVGFGDASDVPVVADWDGDNVTTPGVARGSSAGW